MLNIIVTSEKWTYSDIARMERSLFLVFHYVFNNVEFSFCIIHPGNIQDPT